MCLRGCILKIYNEGEDIESKARRTTTVFTKTLVVGKISNNLECVYQRKVLALSQIPEDERSGFMGKVLLVRKVEKLPMRCIVSSKEVLFLEKTKIIPLDEASNVLQEWFCLHKQYNVVDPPDFLSETRNQIVSGFEIIDNYFKSKKLSVAFSIVNLGIEINDTGKAIPVWIREGVNPTTSNIYNGNTIMENCHDLAKIILPGSVYEKEIAGKGQ
jgi:hypothetical protein